MGTSFQPAQHGQANSDVTYPCSRPDPLGDLLAAIFLGIQRTLFNQSPTANPKQDPDVVGGFITGDVGESDPDDDPLSVALVQGPSKGSVVVNSDGTYRYKPSDALAATGGTDSFTVTITETNAANHIHGLTGLINAFLHAITGGAIPLNDGSSITKTVTVTVAAITPNENSAPVTGNPAFTIDSVNTDTGVVMGHINVTDPDNDTLTYTLDNPPAASTGTVTVDSATGAWIFTPTTTALVGAWSGDDQTTAFTIAASDGAHDTAVSVTASVGVSTDALIALLKRYGSAPSGVAVGSDGTAYVTNSGANTLSIIVNGSITSTITVGKSPSAVAVDSTGRIWITNAGDNTVSVLNISGSRLHNPIAVGSAPAGIAFGSDGTAYVANAGDSTVTVIDPTTYTVRQTLTVGTTPTGIAAGPDGRIYTANYGDGTISVIDPANEYTIDTITLDNATPYGITITNDGTIAITDPINNTVTEVTPVTIPDVYTPVEYTALTTSPNPTTLVTSSAGLSYSINPLAINNTPTAITHDASGNLYTTNTDSNTVTVINPQVGIAKTITIGATPVALATNLNGLVYVVSQSDNILTIVSTQTGASTTIPVGVDPYAVTVGHNGELLVVSNSSGTMKVISPTESDLPAYQVSATAAPLLSIGEGEAIAVGPDGTTYVAVGKTIVALRLSGVIQTATLGYGAGNITSQQLAVGENNLVYKVQEGNLYSIDFSGTSATNISTAQLISIPDGHDGNFDGHVTEVEIGPSGRIYAIVNNSMIAVLNLDGSLLRSIDLASPIAGETSSVTDLHFGPDESVFALYLKSLASQVAVVQIDWDASKAVPIELDTLGIDTTVGGFAVAKDGTVYIANNSTNIVTVLNPDRSLKAIVPVALPLHAALAYRDGHVFKYLSTIGIGPDGNVYALAGGQTAVVISATDLSLKTLDLSYRGNKNGVSIDLATGSGGVAVFSESYDLPGGYPVVDAISKIDTAATPAAPEPPPNAPAPQVGYAYDAGPTTAKGLLERLIATTDHAGNDGIHIDKTYGSDGQVRYVVYFGGTGFSAKQTVLRRNVDLFVNHTADSGFIDMIKAAISDDKESPIMLVGFSQGGMDAQLIAAAMTSEGYDVTDVITFASPVISEPYASYRSLHLVAMGDFVPYDFQQKPTNSIRSYLYQGIDEGTVFVRSVGVQVMAHTLIPGGAGMRSYFNLADEFDDPGNSSSFYDAVKADIVIFAGDVELSRNNMVRIDDGTPGGTLVSRF